MVGFVFVLRDYAQREIGHSILFATALAGRPHLVHGGPRDRTGLRHCIHPVGINRLGHLFLHASPPISQRILLSSIIALPVDTLAFQYLAGYLTPAAFVTEVLSKAVGVLIVWYLLRMRDRKLAIA